MRLATWLWLLALVGAPSMALASPEAVESARQALVSGKPDEAFLALEAAPPGAEEEGAHVAILTAVARSLLDRSDPIFALQACKKALALRPDDLPARLTCLEAAVGARSHDETKLHLEVLERSLPRDPGVVLARARFAASEAEWSDAKRAAERLALLPDATEAQRQEAKTIFARAEEGTRSAEAMQVEQRVRRRTEIMARHRVRQPEQGEAAPEKKGWDGLGPHVVLFCDTSRLCRRVRHRLNAEEVRYEDRNLSLDQSARTELEALGFARGDVPIFEMHGETTRKLGIVFQRLKEHGERP